MPVLPVLPVLPPQIPQYGAGVVEVKRDAGDKWGLAAVGLTVLAAVLHAAAVIIRGISVDRVPWGNMYEFTLVVGLIAVVAWLATLAKMPALRYLGLFVMLLITMPSMEALPVCRRRNTDVAITVTVMDHLLKQYRHRFRRFDRGYRANGNV